MTESSSGQVGSVLSVWRYPVKSMLGEELVAGTVTDLGVLADRGFAVVDRTDGRVASAKNPRKWPRMFECRAIVATEPTSGVAARVRMTLPDGTSVDSDAPDVDATLSRALGRPVTLAHASAIAGQESFAEEYWPEDVEELERRDDVTEFALPEGTFFDAAPVHLLATATIDRLRQLYPAGRFEVRRFRPNVVVGTGGEPRFEEDGWLGRTLRLGDEVVLRVAAPCHRCVMTTLPQGDLPKDSGILRTAARHHDVAVGVYAAVVQGGLVRRGDAVRLV